MVVGSRMGVCSNSRALLRLQHGLPKSLSELSEPCSRVASGLVYSLISTLPGQLAVRLTWKGCQGHFDDLTQDPSVKMSEVVLWRAAVVLKRSTVVSHLTLTCGSRQACLAVSTRPHVPFQTHPPSALKGTGSSIPLDVTQSSRDQSCSSKLVEH